MMNLESDKANEHTDDNGDDALGTFSKTCHTMYSKISKKQYQYFQAMTIIQDDILDSCNGLVKKQVDMLEEYSNCGIVSKGYMMPILRMVNSFIEFYLNYVSIEYDLVLSRMQLHHKMLMMVNDSTPKLMHTYMESIKLLKTFSLQAF